MSLPDRILASLARFWFALRFFFGLVPAEIWILVTVIAFGAGLLL